MEPQAPDEEAMVKVAVADLRGRFKSIDRSRIEATVRRSVRELFARAQVKTFVGIIAQRRARAELKKLAPETALDPAVDTEPEKTGV
jgi:hypothetical protein